MDERRKHERHRVWFPLSLQVLGEGEEAESQEEAFAISYDVSSSGLLLACPGKLEPGTRVRIRIHAVDPDEAEDRDKVGDPEEPVMASGEILRVTEADPTQFAGPWRYQMAVRFAEPVPWLEEVLKNAAARD